MPKEHDQRTENELLFRCNCGGDHFVSFAWKEWDKNDIEFWVSVIDAPTPFFYRLKQGLKYIFKGGKNYWSEVGLTSKDLERVQMLIDGYLEQVKI